MTNRNILWWLLLIATIPSFISLVRKGFFPMHDDLPVYRQFAVEECLKDGQIPCRWTKELGFGYGYPLMNFYPPLPYILGLVPRAMGLSLLDTTKLIFILGFVLSAGFMARLGSLFFDKWGSAAAALLYLYGPYHAVDLYVRGDVNELFAMAFFPAVLWASYKLIKKPKLKTAVVLSLCFAGISLSHVGMTMIMTPVLALWSALWLIVFGRKKLKKTLGALFLSGIFSVGLSAFFLIPVIFEKSLVHVETLTMGYFNFLAHFVDLNQLFLSRFWGYGASVYGPNDGMSFQIGILHWTLALIALLGLVKWWKTNRPLALATLFFLITFLVSAFMSHWKSTPIWLHLPMIEFLQFPWRLLALILPSVSFLAAAVIVFIPSKFKSVSLFLLLLLLLFVYGAYFQPQTWWPDKSDDSLFSGQTWQKALTAGIFDYLPKWSAMPPGSAAPRNAQASASAAVITLEKRSNRQRYLVDNLTPRPITLQVNTLYYPGWEALINAKPAAISVGGPEKLGLINLVILPGRNLVDLEFTETPLRRFADTLSLVSWLLLAFYLIREKTKHGRT